MSVITRRNALSGVAGLALSAGLAACSGQRPVAVDAWTGAVLDLAIQIFADAPEAAPLATQAVQPPRFRAQLSDRSAIGEEVRRTAAVRRFVQLKAFDLADIAPDQRRRHLALVERLGAVADVSGLPFGRLDPDGRYRLYAVDPVNAAFFALPAIFDATPAFATPADAAAFAARLASVPAAIAGDVAKLQADAAAGFAPPLIVLDRAIVTAEAIAALPLESWPFRAAFVQRAVALVGALDAAQPSAEAARMRALLGEIDAMIRNQIAPAYQRGVQAMRALRARAPGDPSVARAPDAQVAWRRVLDAALGPGVDLVAVRAQTEARVAALTTQLDAGLRALGLGDGSVGQRLAQARLAPRAQPLDPEGLRALVLQETANDAARGGSVFGENIGPAAPPVLTVQRAPVWRELIGFPTAYRGADGPSGASLLVPLNDLARTSPIDVALMAFRDGAPGKHVAASLSGQSGDPTASVLRLYASPAASEGWPIYALALAEEIGLADGRLDLQVAVLRGQLMAAAAALFELDLHSATNTWEPALARYTALTGATRPEAERLGERIASEPGAGLSGEVGRAAIAALRDRARQALGPRFDLKSFHTVLLAAMPGSIAALTRAVEDWIARR